MEYPKHKKSILIVDDENDIRVVLRSLLELDGYRVTEAVDGQEALDLLLKSNFDLMILDLLMPRMSGEEVIQKLDEDRLKAMPTIILTAKLEKQIVRKECLSNISFYVIKPFNNLIIRELVKCLLSDLDEVEREKALQELLM